MAQIVQCDRCGKYADISKPIVFRHSDDSPMEPDERPQPWVRCVFGNLQPSYVLPNGAQWPAQEREFCPDCVAGLLGLLSADLSSAPSINEPAVPVADLVDVVELANKVDVPVPDAVPDQGEVIDVGEVVAEVPAEA